MQRSWSFVLLAVALSVSSIARAGEGEERNKAAAELSAAVMPPAQYAEMMSQIVDASVQSIDAEVKANGASLPEGFADRFRAEMERLLPHQELLDLQAGLLAKYYTASEINELAAFYRSPLGQKALKVMPAVMADSMTMVQSKLTRELPNVIQRLFSSAEPEAAPEAKPAKAPPATKAKKK